MKILLGAVFTLPLLCASGCNQQLQTQQRVHKQLDIDFPWEEQFQRNEKATTELGILNQGVTVLDQYVGYYLQEVFSYSQYHYQNQQLSRKVIYGGPGTDLNWFSSDDGIAYYYDYPLTDIERIYYNGPGDDTQWLTPDDLINQYRAPLRDRNGQTLGLATFASAGADGIWFNEDDSLAWWIAQTTQGQQQRWVQYLSAGADQDWTTVNDNAITYFGYTELDANGRTSRQVLYQGTGADGQPFSADDQPLLYRDYQYNANGQEIQMIFYHGGPGADAVWFNADDLIRSCKYREYNPTTNQQTRAVTYQPGPDAQCGTADDLVWDYGLYEYDANGELSLRKSYYGVGTDGLWFTTDDILVSEHRYIHLL